MTWFVAQSVLYFLGGAVMGAAIVLNYRVQQKRQNN
jgi:hypothetical protein